MSDAPAVGPDRPRRRARGLRTLVLLSLLFLAPFALAPLLYYGSSWRPLSNTHNGTLISPPRPLAASFLHGKWSMVYIGPGSCDSHCRWALYFMRQTHLGLGQQYARVQRVFLATTPCCDRDYLAREYPRLDTVDMAATRNAKLLADFPTVDRDTAIFVVDPNGNLMMSYDSTDKPHGLLEDLQRLLSLSNIG